MKVAKPKPKMSVKNKDDMPLAPGYCGTCVKVRRVHSAKYECTVLNVMIGCEEECWAWSDDLKQQEEIERAVKKYYGEKEGKTCPNKKRSKKKKK